MDFMYMAWAVVWRLLLRDLSGVGRGLAAGISHLHIVALILTLAVTHIDGSGRLSLFCLSTEGKMNIFIVFACAQAQRLARGRRINRDPWW